MKIIKDFDANNNLEQGVEIDIDDEKNIKDNTTNKNKEISDKELKLYIEEFINYDDEFP